MISSNVWRPTACLRLACTLLPIAGIPIADSSGNFGSKAIAKPPRHQNLYLVGQDLGALRGYVESRCCLSPDGVTAYVTLYELLDPRANFGGLGLDADLRPVKSEKGWGSGPVSAWKAAQEFDRPYLAIGLDLSEGKFPDGLRRIVSGEFDQQIRQLAKFSELTGKSVFLRIGYEFDGRWNTGYDNHDNYRAAWRHIVERIREHGAGKVEFVWQGSASPIDDVIDNGHEDISLWYPGNAYVDWVGASLFLPLDEHIRVPDPPYRPATARLLLDELLTLARERGKPVMIAELSPQGLDLRRKTRRNISPLWDGYPGQDTELLSADQAWRLWFEPVVSYLVANDDVIDAVAYINVNWDSQSMWGRPYSNGYWGDSRLETWPVLARRWDAAIAQWRNRQNRPTNEKLGSEQ